MMYRLSPAKAVTKWATSLRPHGKRRQLQSCNPAFGARLRMATSCSEKIQVHDLIEKASGFGGGEAQIGGVHFGHLAVRAVFGRAVVADPHVW